MYDCCLWIVVNVDGRSGTAQGKLVGTLEFLCFMLLCLGHLDFSVVLGKVGTCVTAADLVY